MATSDKARNPFVTRDRGGLTSCPHSYVNYRPYAPYARAVPSQFFRDQLKCHALHFGSAVATQFSSRGSRKSATPGWTVQSRHFILRTSEHRSALKAMCPSSHSAKKDHFGAE